MNGASAHERYSGELEALAGEDLFARAAQEAAARWGWGEERVCHRMHERFEPDREPYATCLLASAGEPQRIVRLDAFRARSPDLGRGQCVVDAARAGRMRASPFPSDSALPTLEQALAGPGRSVVRYRPGRRCTIRVDDAKGTRFLKVYANGLGERAHGDGLRLWRSAQHGELGFAVAEPERFDPMLRAVWQRAVAGVPASDRLRGPDGEEVAKRLGRAAGTLASAGVRPERRRGRRDELARARLRSDELGRRVPGLADAARDLVAAFEKALGACEAADPRPVHGALHASQWLDDGTGVALLDYESIVLGDPELDAATFLADLDAQNRDRVPVDRLSAAFLAGFEASAGALDRRLLAGYRAMRGLEKALRVARAVRPDGDRKAERRLRRASGWLA